MRMIKTIAEFSATAANRKQLILYGAGWAGKMVCRFLKSNNTPISAFAVTMSCGYKEIEGVPVYGIDEILERTPLDEAAIVLTATKANQCAIEKELEKRKIYSYSVLSDILLYKITAENRKFDAEEAELKKGSDRNEKKVGFLTPGYLDSDYAEKRLIINKIEDISYTSIPKETLDFFDKNSEYEDQPEIFRQLSEACYAPDRYTPEVGLIHTFNTVCRTDKPWCASFETSMPRMLCRTEYEKEYYLQLVDYMKKPNCKALYALCKNAYEIQEASLAAASVSAKDIDLLMQKTKVLHPPQEILITEEEFEKKHDTGKIHFIFVGAFFFLKGGREIIQVLSEFDGKYDFDLTLISSLLYDDFFTKTSYEEMLKYQRLIRECKWITYYEHLPNKKVLEKCREATVGLLPSVAETYGYSVLEMQAAGCPVITTNVRAFPETNGENCGWICRLPVDGLGVCTEQDTKIWSELLKDELRNCFLEIFRHPEHIKIKGRNAMEKIKKMHDPHMYQTELRKALDLL